MRWYKNSDGNFIEQFQSTGFDARIWELYLWATFVSLGYEVTMPKPSPDFVARGLGGEFAIEATTLNPTIKHGEVIEPPRPEKVEDLQAYGEHYLPIRYAGALITKLNKRYWDQPDAMGKPLIIAVQDFHDEMSMRFSQGGLIAYLYGISIFDNDPDTGKPALITEHAWGTKVVPSGFFTLPDSEHISAVIFNSQGTLAKFNRIAIKCGFDPRAAQLIHIGRRLDFTGDAPTQVPFTAAVTIDYPEDWVDGMDVFHNPNASIPLNPDLIPGAAHHIQTPGGNMRELYPEEHLLTSTTRIIISTGG